ncbi:MAG: AarF/ABC1/UbiB kinase family protein [Candidatus Schekmanbacteria bacterium]|nr:AarF/ABC1/UbiB kinase family protein [Candidatus Schekmanbacteria bacterium]
MSNQEKISNVKRLRQIANVFVKHGLGQIVTISGLDSYISFGKRLFLSKEEEGRQVEYTNPQRLVMAFEELGVTFIKLGQVLSSRKDQLPREYIVEFEKLQDQVTPLPFEQVDAVFRAEFGQSTQDVLESIDQNCLASGSIGQVHAAKLNGENVVVKIRKPGIEHTINADVKILYFIAQRVKTVWMRDNKTCDPVDMVKMFETVIRNELDYGTEGKNIERFRHNFQNVSGAYFPKIHWEYSCSRVLVMEKIEGISIGDLEKLRAQGHDLKKLAANLFDIYMKQLFVDAFFHADPHPGNIFVMDDGTLGIIDCGMAGYMEDYFVKAFIDCFVGLFLKDYDVVVRGYRNVGSLGDDVDIAAFKNDIRNLSEHYMGISLNTISIGSLLDDITDVAVRNKMKIPATMFYVTKTLVTLEGTVRKLDPGFDFVAHSTGFAQTLVAEKSYDVKRMIADLLDFFYGVSNFIRNLPKQTSRIFSLVEEQKFGVVITLKGSDDFYSKLDNYFSRVSLALISAGLGVASSLLIQAKIAPVFCGVSFLGIFGYLMAVVLGLWVIYLIVFKK